MTFLSAKRPWFFSATRSKVSCMPGGPQIQIFSVTRAEETPFLLYSVSLSPKKPASHLAAFFGATSNSDVSLPSTVLLGVRS